MRQDSLYQARLDETCRMIAQTAPRVEALLARHFPAAGGCLYPDASGNVCVAEGDFAARDRPACVYARCSAKLSSLVESFSAAALDQAALACIRLAKERTVFACALDLARHPLDPMQRQLFVARMMPAPSPLHRQDDATASCIWQRLWTLHAWVLELRLVIALSTGPSMADQTMLQALDRDLSALLRPDAPWLSVDLGNAGPGEMMARAPVETVGVGRLAWPNRLGALLPEADLTARCLQRRGMRVSQEDGSTWLIFEGFFVEAAALNENHLPAARRPAPVRFRREAVLAR